MARYVEFINARPSEVREMLASVPVAYVPCGALEWHGEHNPLGLDGVKAEALLRGTAEVTGGVLFPTIYWGVFHTMMFPFTFHFQPTILIRMVKRMFRELEEDGFKVIVMLTGHYAPTQILHVFLQARRFNRKSRGAVALAFPEMALCHDLGYYGDHAASWETSIMLALRPELVDVSALPEAAGAFRRTRECGVMGYDPVRYSSVALGEKVVEMTVGRLSELVSATLESGSDEAYRVVWKRYARAIFSLASARAQLGLGRPPGTTP